MSNWALYLGICAALAAAYSLLGGMLERTFGVDPTRMTPAQKTGKRGGAAFVCAHLVVCAAGGLRLGGMAVQRFGQNPALVMLLLAGVFLLAPMHMAALFVSVRHEGKGLSEAAGELLGTAAKKSMLLVQALICALMLGGIAAWIPGLCLVQALMLSELLAPRMTSEGHIRPLAFGGAMVTAAAACAGALGFEPSVDGWLVLTALLLVCAGGMLLAAGCAAAIRLFERDFWVGRKPGHERILAPVGFAAAASGLFFAPVDLDIAVHAVAVASAMLSLLLCGAWLKRIGRSWAWMAVSAVWLAIACALLTI